jgi:eukaryotic-like serine/threonine-protein kinase
MFTTVITAQHRERAVHGVAEQESRIAFEGHRVEERLGPRILMNDRPRPPAIRRPVDARRLPGHHRDGGVPIEGLHIAEVTLRGIRRSDVLPRVAAVEAAQQRSTTATDPDHVGIDDREPAQARVGSRGHGPPCCGLGHDGLPLGPPPVGGPFGGSFGPCGRRSPQHTAGTEEQQTGDRDFRGHTRRCSPVPTRNQYVPHTPPHQLMDPTSSFVESLLERCILALEAGDQHGVDAVLAAHPDVAPQLRVQIEQLSALGILHGPKAPDIPERLGEFRLLRQLGRGGMGIVYLAEQESLHRQVALKLVHPEQLYFPGARERFRREVLAIARLQHSGIVPILTCGEVDNVPFYAMELVAGASLSEILLELAGTAPASLDGTALRHALQRAMAKKHETATIADAPVFEGSWTNACCRLALDAAEALRHAHEQGVLHRDVKPSNLLLCANGQLRLIDFGLASAEGEQRITRSGSAFGSLPYMAPEQVRGDTRSIDPRTDVYSLGVTLYELLTLTLPHGDGSGTTRERILAGLIEPPARRNARIHPDVEAVCLMAMDPDRDRRYPTAAAFADDLRAFLEQRTVRARRPSWGLRTRRWARRHPARAATIAVAFLLLGPVPVAFGVQQSLAANRLQLALDEVSTQRTLAERNLGEAQRQKGLAEGNLEEANKQRKLAEESLKEADHSLDLAEQNLETALKAVDKMLFRPALDILTSHPRTAKLRRDLMQDALGIYEQLLKTTPTDADNLRVRAQRARTQVRLARLLVPLGDHQKALAAVSEAIQTFEALAGGSRPPATNRELATAYDQLSVIFGHLERFGEQQAAAEKAIAMFEASSVTPADRDLVSTILQNSRGDLAISLARTNKFPEAHAQLDLVEHEVEQPPPAALQEGSRREWLLNSVQVHDQRGAVWSLQGETDRAMQSFEKALEQLERLPSDIQQHENAQSCRLGLLQRLGQLCLQRRDWQRGAKWLDAAVDALEVRVKHDPDVVEYRAQLAELLGSRATNSRELHDAAGSLADNDRAIALLEHVVIDAPDEIHHLRRLAIAMAERAGTRFVGGNKEGALADLESAEQHFTQALNLAPNDPLAVANYAAVLGNHARALADVGDMAKAREKTQLAIDIARGRIAGESARSLIELLTQAADLAMQDQDVEAGKVWIAEATDRAKAWLQERPDDTLRQATTAMILSNRATMHLQLSEHERAIELWEEALPIARPAAKSTPFGRQVLAVILLRLADVAERDGKIDVAREWFASAIKETGATKAKMRSYAPLAALFDHPAMQDLLPKPKPTSK